MAAILSRHQEDRVYMWPVGNPLCGVRGWYDNRGGGGRRGGSGGGGWSGVSYVFCTQPCPTTSPSYKARRRMGGWSSVAVLHPNPEKERQDLRSTWIHFEAFRNISTICCFLFTEGLSESLTILTNPVVDTVGGNVTAAALVTPAQLEVNLVLYN